MHMYIMCSTVAWSICTVVYSRLRQRGWGGYVIGCLCACMSVSSITAKVTDFALKRFHDWA